MIKNWDTRDTGKTCKDSWDRDCGTFWVFDLDDLEDSLWIVQRDVHEAPWKIVKEDNWDQLPKFNDHSLLSALQDTILDGMSSESDYWHYQTWRKNEDVTIVLGGLIEQTEYSHIYCFAEDDEPDGPNPSS